MTTNSNLATTTESPVSSSPTIKRTPTHVTTTQTEENANETAPTITPTITTLTTTQTTTQTTDNNTHNNASSSSQPKEVSGHPPLLSIVMALDHVRKSIAHTPHTFTVRTQNTHTHARTHTKHGQHTH